MEGSGISVDVLELLILVFLIGVFSRVGGVVSGLENLRRAMDAQRDWQVLEMELAWHREGKDDAKKLLAWRLATYYCELWLRLNDATYFKDATRMLEVKQQLVLWSKRAGGETGLYNSHDLKASVERVYSRLKKMRGELGNQGDGNA